MRPFLLLWKREEQSTKLSLFVQRSSVHYERQVMLYGISNKKTKERERQHRLCARRERELVWCHLIQRSSTSPSSTKASGSFFIFFSSAGVVVSCRCLLLAGSVTGSSGAGGPFPLFFLFVRHNLAAVDAFECDVMYASLHAIPKRRQVYIPCSEKKRGKSNTRDVKRFPTKLISSD